MAAISEWSKKCPSKREEKAVKCSLEGGEAKIMCAVGTQRMAYTEKRSIPKHEARRKMTYTDLEISLEARKTFLYSFPWP